MRQPSQDDGAIPSLKDGSTRTDASAQANKSTCQIHGNNQFKPKTNNPKKKKREKNTQKDVEGPWVNATEGRDGGETEERAEECAKAVNWAEKHF